MTYAKDREFNHSALVSSYRRPTDKSYYKLNMTYGTYSGDEECAPSYFSSLEAVLYDLNQSMCWFRKATIEFFHDGKFQGTYKVKELTYDETKNLQMSRYNNGTFVRFSLL